MLLSKIIISVYSIFIHYEGVETVKNAHVISMIK